jgi:hypothetical protein
VGDHLLALFQEIDAVPSHTAASPDALRAVLGELTQLSQNTRGWTFLKDALAISKDVCMNDEMHQPLNLRISSIS